MNESARNKLIEANLHLPKICATRLAKGLPPRRGNLIMEELILSGNVGLVQAATHYDERDSTQFKSFANHRVKGAMLDYLRTIDLQTRAERKTKTVLERTAVSIKVLEMKPTTRWSPGQVEARVQAENLLGKLQPRYAAVVRMRYLEDASLETIGAAFGVTGGRVSQIISTSIELLRSLGKARSSQMQQYSEAEPAGPR